VQMKWGSVGKGQADPWGRGKRRMRVSSKGLQQPETASSWSFSSGGIFHTTGTLGKSSLKLGNYFPREMMPANQIPFSQEWPTPERRGKSTESRGGGLDHNRATTPPLPLSGPGKYLLRGTHFIRLKGKGQKKRAATSAGYSIKKKASHKENWRGLW